MVVKPAVCNEKEMQRVVRRRKRKDQEQLILLKTLFDRDPHWSKKVVG